MKNKELRIEVIFDVFSGYPNPRWMLSKPQVEKLKERLQIQKIYLESKRYPKLGYRGFIIRNLSKVNGIPELMRVYHKVLSIKVKNVMIHFKDIANIERWFFNLASEHGYAKLIEHVMDDDKVIEKL